MGRSTVSMVTVALWAFGSGCFGAVAEEVANHESNLVADSGACSVAPNPVTIDGLYTVSGANLGRRTRVTIRIQVGSHSESFNRRASGSGTVSVTTDSPVGGSGTVTVSSRRDLRLAQCAFSVIAPPDAPPPPPPEPGACDPTTLTHPVCEATSGGRCYYVANVPGSGAGTFSSPFGMADLPRSDTSWCSLSSPAIEALQPGDILYFRGGTYPLETCPGSNYYYMAYIRPAGSGVAGAPITFKAYPAETVTLRVASGGQPAIGTYPFSYIRIEGFVVDRSSIQPRSEEGAPGVGLEIAYNEVIGEYIPTTDNHDGIRLEHVQGAWVHHNIFRGVQGDSTNSAGIKLNDTFDVLIEDNYIHSNRSGVFDKDAGVRNTYRRNFFTANTGDQFLGNGMEGGLDAQYFVYDSVFDGAIELHTHSNGSEIHDNLVRGGMLAGAWAGNTWNVRLWNNIVISNASSIVAFREPQNPFTNSGPSPHLRYADHNVYDAAPVYDFGQYAGAWTLFTLSQMQSMNFELQAHVAASPADIFVDQVAYELRAERRGTGRFSDDVGPANIAAVLNVSRYGPAARPCPTP